ncbi:MAG: hypothetical protein Alpg2KO_07890 [Alphaproteobacteria bacterium]
MTDWSDLPQMGQSDWHNRWGGRRWRHDATGIYIDNKTTPERTPGEPETMRAILRLMEAPLKRACVEFWIPAELVLMTIATETAAYRRQGFTGPATFRWENHVKVKDVSPPDVGDYSAGPMQMLAIVARERIRRDNLPVAPPFDFAPHFRDQPNIPPDDLPFYGYRGHLTVGAAELADRMQRIGSDDPILNAARWNAGSLRETRRNPWHIFTHGNHLDRAARWYGDACAVLSGLRNGA